MIGAAGPQSPASPIRGWAPSGEFAPDAWLDGRDSVSVRATSASRRRSCFRQAPYVAMDVILVCLGATVVYGARFGFAHRLGIESASARQLIHQAYTQTYPAFLLLYVALIVMAFMSQHLYRTSKEIRGLEESIKVAKAGGFPTVLLVLFVFFSGNKQSSQLISASPGIPHIAPFA